MKKLVTYRRADGGSIGEYAIVFDTEYFGPEYTDEDYIEVIEETWMPVRTTTLIFGNTVRYCAECDQEVELKEPVNDDVYCGNCPMDDDS